MPWYREGTVTVTNGSKLVVGVDTFWDTIVEPGDVFCLLDANGLPTGPLYEVDRLVRDVGDAHYDAAAGSNNPNRRMVLKQNYQGSTASARTYAILNTTGEMTTPRFAARLQSYIDTARTLNSKPNESPQPGGIPQAVGQTTKIDSAWIKDATDTVKGVVELATNAETQTGTDTVRAVTPAGVKAVLQQTTYSPVTIYARDSLRAAVEAGTGGRQTVMYDDLGQPSYMVLVPAFALGTIDPLLGSTAALHPAFTQNGVKKELWVGAYLARIYNGRACSLPGVDPTASINFDGARTACTSKGAGWHLLNNWEWAAIALWCLKNEFQPRGNTNWGRSHEAPYETGARGDNGTPGAATGTGRTQTGSGPASWRHDRTFSGLADLVGNVWEWTDGLKLIDGKIHMPVDNRPDLAEASWPDTGCRFNSTVAEGGAPVLSDAITNTVETNSSSVVWKDMTKKVGLTVPASLAAAAIAPITHLDGGAYTEQPKGTIYMRNVGERVPFRGGTWNNAADAGLFYLNCGHVRSLVSTHLGFRPAFLV